MFLRDHPCSHCALLAPGPPRHQYTRNRPPRDVSEVTFFRYFERKEDIFWVALAACFDTLTPRLSALESNGRTAAPEVFVPRILSILIDTATFSPELVRLVAVALLEVHGKAEEVCRQHLAP